ncbi:phage tail terminator family protein [Paenibacillus sp. MAH-36]|uniref:Uncharacterized protein n=1 Tax=Paenibacillus violae TaxID=3077234 RepID=A0ABU3R7A7_9BACL|nr:hypothetical protein [Paenibacillus sp. PFR10]MDU0200162.1 hypothetical protein [Paenibacillus sp. PFR10]
MLTLKDIAKAINTRLSTAIPEIPINSTDVREGFERPSFYVDFDEANRAPVFTWATERTLQVIIYFFPTSQYDYQIEMLDIQQRIEDALDGTIDLVPDGSFKAWIYELETTKVDGVMQTGFEIHYIEDKDEADDNTEDMEELILNLEGDETIG